jgi:hypothetical protein
MNWVPSTMPLRPERAGKVGVIRAPVAKTAVVASALTPPPGTGGPDCVRGRGRHTQGGPPPLLGAA